MTQTRTVRIVDRWSAGEWTRKIISVTVPWVCCTCGGPRGEPYNHNFHEDGDWLSCDRWDNPCGHLDKYGQVYLQSLAFPYTAHVHYQSWAGYTSTPVTVIGETNKRFRVTFESGETKLVPKSAISVREARS